MSISGRISTFIRGFFLILAAIIVFINPVLEGISVGKITISLAVSIFILFHAIKNLIYYFTMARLMVGGKTILYRGILFLDLGLFTLIIFAMPDLYLKIIMGSFALFYGVIVILRANEQKKHESNYIFKLVEGIIYLVASIFVFVSIALTSLTFIIFGVVFALYGIIAIYKTFKRSSVTFIQ